jgi:hypothetical protein
MVWKPIPGWEGRYEVSDRGKVRSCSRVRTTPSGGIARLKPKVLATTIGGRAENYRRVMLMNPKKHAYVHHLIALAFLGPRPPGCLILHRNDNGFDNRIDNIRYGCRDENELDRYVARISKRLEPAPF